MLNSIKILITIFGILGICSTGFGQHRIFNRADSLIMEEEYTLAIQEYLAYINIDSISHICYAGIGYCYFKKADTLKAISHFYTSLKLQPDYFEGLYQLGHVLQQSNKIEQAKLKYREAISLLNNKIPDFKKRNASAAYNNLGVIYMENEKNPDSAIRMYTEAIELDPKYLDAIQNRGKAYLMNYQFKEAKIDLENARKLNGNPEFINYGLFYVYWNESNYKTAYEMLITSNLNFFNSVDFRLAGLICYLNSDNKRSLQFYRKIEIQERTDEDYVHLAYLSFLLEKDFCELFSEINYDSLKSSQETLKTSLKKYRVIKKKCKSKHNKKRD